MARDYEPREGDERGEEQKVQLTLRPAHNQPFRWLPKHGEPLCIGEWASQHLVRFFAYLPVYTALVASIILVVVIWHPFGLGG